MLNFRIFKKYTFHTDLFNSILRINKYLSFFSETILENRNCHIGMGYYLTVARISFLRRNKGELKDNCHDKSFSFFAD